MARGSAPAFGCSDLSVPMRNKVACVPSIACVCAQAFELCVRPALDSPTAALDRVKMTIYTKFAEWGLPCPVTGHSSTDQPQAQTVTVLH